MDLGPRIPTHATPDPDCTVFQLIKRATPWKKLIGESRLARYMTAFDREAYLVLTAKLVDQRTGVSATSGESRSRQLKLRFRVVPEKPASVESSKADAW